MPRSDRTPGSGSSPVRDARGWLALAWAVGCGLAYGAMVVEQRGDKVRGWLAPGPARTSASSARDAANSAGAGRGATGTTPSSPGNVPSHDRPTSVRATAPTAPTTAGSGRSKL